MTNILSFLSVYSNFIVSSIQSIVLFIVNIPNYLNFLISSLFVLPSVLVPYMTVSIGIYIVFLLMKKGTN